MLVLYAVTNGYLDRVPVERVREWEHSFHREFAASYPDVVERIREAKAMKDDDMKALGEAIAKFTTPFVSTPVTA